MLSHSQNLKQFLRIKNTIENSRIKTKIGAMMQMTVTAVSKDYVITESNCFRVVWDFLLLSGIMFYVLSSPIRLAIAVQVRHLTVDNLSSQFSFLDYTFDAVFVLDAVFRSFLFVPLSDEYGVAQYCEEHVNLIWDYSTIRRFYKNSQRFYKTIALLIPFDLFALLHESPLPFGMTLALCRLSKLFSLALLPVCLQDIFSFFEKEIHFAIGTDRKTILYLGIVTVISCIWLSCIWDIIGQNSDDRESRTWFVDRLYFVLTTMTTTGYGDIVPVTTLETLFVVLTSIVGPTLFATIVASFASYVHSYDISSDNIEHRLQVVTSYLLSLPEGEYREVSSYVCFCAVN
jgi:hypothetical protein